MPNVAFPSFFGESFRSSIRSSSRHSLAVASAPAAAEPPELAETSEIQPASLTPFTPQQPSLHPGLHRDVQHAVQLQLKPTALAAQSILRSATLKKRSKQVSSLWQHRYVVLEGPPTNVLVYYYASAATATDDASVKPRGVVPLSVRTTPRPARTSPRPSSCMLKNGPFACPCAQDATAALTGKDSGTSFRVKGPQRAYDFKAATPSEAVAWVRAISDSAAAARLPGVRRDASNGAASSASSPVAPEGAASSASLQDRSSVAAPRRRWSLGADRSAGGSTKDSSGAPQLLRPFRSAAAGREQQSAPARHVVVTREKADSWVDVSDPGMSTVATASGFGTAAPTSGGGLDAFQGEQGGAIDAMDQERRTGGRLSKDL